MASKLEYLLSILEKNQHRHLKGSLPRLKEPVFRKSLWNNEATAMYQSLGGIQPTFQWLEPGWDLEFEGFAIQLDESFHFNRYRGATLKSIAYNEITFFPVDSYKRFCRQYEGDCLKAATQLSLWTDQESERHFGHSQEQGDLSFKGSAKWKQRAFMDFLEDLSAYLLKIKLIRISIYDNLMVNNKIIRLDNLLMSRNSQNEKYIWNYLVRRIPS